VIRTSSDGASITFSTVRGLSLVCSFLISLIRFEIDVGRFAEVEQYCHDLTKLAACGWARTAGTGATGSADCEPDAVSPWSGVCWAGAEGGSVTCGCGFLEGAAACFSCAAFSDLMS
jgi:hypothetical protein